MDQANLRVTLIQPDIIWEDIESNLKKLMNILGSEVSDTDLIILPEYFTTGFTINPHKFAITMDSGPVKWMKSIVDEKQCAITGSLLIKENNKIYNRLIFIDKDKNLSFYNKRHLFKMGGEESSQSPGRNKLITKIGQWRISLLICYDLRFPVWSRNKNDYDVLIYVANWPAVRNNVWNTLLKARAMENLAYVIGVNRIGKDGRDITYSGNSLIYDPHGRIIARLTPNQEKTGTFILSFDKLNNIRRKFPVHLDADNFEILDKP
jgi:omega-amidase